MRKVFLFMMVSLDGYFEGPHHELDWHNVDKEFVEFALEQLKETDTLLFGRVTYQMMADFWTSNIAKKTDPLTAAAMNSLPKVVVSQTLRKANWSNSRLIGSNVKAEILKLKRQHGNKKIALLGSSNLAISLLKDNLIDEIRIMVNPLVLGKGHPLFMGMDGEIKLKLLKTKVFRSGNVLLYYKPAQIKA